MDAVLEIPGTRRLVIIEIKYTHCSGAYRQLERYKELASLWRPKTTVACVELVRWYDRNLPFPTSVSLLRNLPDAEPENFSVKIWNPKRNQGEI